MKKLKKPNRYQIMVVMEWIIIINAIVAAVVDIISPGTLTGWVWAICVALNGWVAIMHLDNIKHLEMRGEYMRRREKFLMEYSDKLLNKVNEQQQQIERMEGEQHENQDQK